MNITFLPSSFKTLEKSIFRFPFYNEKKVAKKKLFLTKQRSKSISKILYVPNNAHDPYVDDAPFDFQTAYAPHLAQIQKKTFPINFF